MGRINNWEELGKWTAKSLVTLSLNLALLTVWVGGLAIPPELAIWINWLTIPVVGYAISDRWVFSEYDAAPSWRGHVKRYVAMLTVNNTGKIGNYIIYVVLIQAGVDYRISWVIGAGIMLLVTFGGNREVWRRGVGG